jgi:predicted dehydrogenase
MAQPKLRLGLIGAGKNMRLRHIPGFRALPDVEIVAVCNRRAASTAEAAREFGIPRTFEHWEDLVADPDIDAIVIGTWPYLHCPITLAALEAGKHVLTEARMSLDAAEANAMLEASRRHPRLTTQIVPSPYGLKGHDLMVELIQSGFLGEVREVFAYSLTDDLADPAAPLGWRQDAALSGYNMLTLGILQETLLRWVPPPVRVSAQVQAFLPTRIDPESGVARAVGTPDSVQVLAVLANGGRAVYQLSGVMPISQGAGIRLYGTEGVLAYDLTADRIYGATRRSRPRAAKPDTLEEIPIPEERARSWRVEADFVEAIRSGGAVHLTDFATGVAYMEFTEAVARSAQQGMAVNLPLEDLLVETDTE